MADLNKFLDLEGLKTFWNQIDKKKQNQEIIIKGKKTTIEDYLNNSKDEIDLEEIKKIIQNYLDENPIEVEGYVPTNRKIAGINLTDDITAKELQVGLSVYPILSGNDVPHNGTVNKAHVGQLYIALKNGSLHRCYATAGGGYTYWQEINANPKGKIAGFTLNENITIQMLQTALGIDEIETTLDKIIAIQENLIGGATE